VAEQRMMSSQRLIQSSAISQTIIWQKHHFRRRN